jgi:hypothetical protein
LKRVRRSCRRRFQVRSTEALEFTAVNGLVRGHADGIIIAGPQLGVYLSYSFTRKAINAARRAGTRRAGNLPRYAHR